MTWRVLGGVIDSASSSPHPRMAEDREWQMSAIVSPMYAISSNRISDNSSRRDIDKFSENECNRQLKNGRRGEHSSPNLWRLTMCITCKRNLGVITQKSLQAGSRRESKSGTLHRAAPNVFAGHNPGQVFRRSAAMEVTNIPSQHAKTRLFAHFQG